MAYFPIGVWPPFRLTKVPLVDAYDQSLTRRRLPSADDDDVFAGRYQFADHGHAGKFTGDE